MKVLLTSILILPLVVFATDYHGLLDQITDTNKMSFGNPVTCSCSNEERTEAEQCAIDLCGPAKSLPSTQLGSSEYEHIIMPEALSKYRQLIPKITEIVRGEVANANNFLDNMKRARKLDMKAIDFSNWEMPDYDSLASSMFEDYVVIEIDTSKPIKDRLKIKPNYPKGVSVLLKNGIDAYISDKRKRLMSNHPIGIVSGVYTNAEANELSRQTLNEFVKDYKVIVASNPNILAKYQSEIDDFLKKIDLTSDLSALELVNILSQITYYEIIIKLQQGATIDYSSSFGCSSSGCIQVVQEIVKSKNINDLIKEFEKTINLNRNIASKLQSCKTALVSYGLNNYDESRIRAELPVVIDNILKKSLRKFSDKSKNSFKNFLDNDLEFSTEIDYSSKEFSSFEELAQKIESDYQNYKDDMEDKEDISQFSFSDLILKFYRDYGSGSELDPISSLGVCDYGAAIDNTVWDSFENKDNRQDKLKKNIVGVSMFAALHLAHGKAIVAHELGHALSYHASGGTLSTESNKEYMKIRQCVASSIKDDVPMAKFGYHLPEHMYVEEDTADLISHSAFNDNNLYDCPLLDVSKDGTRYENLSLEREADNDVHSMPMLRVLREATYKKVDLSPSCQNLIDRAKNQFRFQSCI